MSKKTKQKKIINQVDLDNFLFGHITILKQSYVQEITSKEFTKKIKK